MASWFVAVPFTLPSTAKVSMRCHVFVVFVCRVHGFCLRYPCDLFVVAVSCVQCSCDLAMVSVCVVYCQPGDCIHEMHSWFL